jgi:hypothetical protein
MEIAEIRKLLIEIELERQRHDGVMAHFQEAVRSMLGGSSGGFDSEWTHPTSGEKRIIQYFPLPGRKNRKAAGKDQRKGKRYEQ